TEFSECLQACEGWVCDIHVGPDEPHAVFGCPACRGERLGLDVLLGVQAQTFALTPDLDGLEEGAGFIPVWNALGVGIVQADVCLHELWGGQAACGIVISGAWGMFPGGGCGCDPGDPLPFDLDIHQCCAAAEAGIENVHDVPLLCLSPVGSGVVGAGHP